VSSLNLMSGTYEFMVSINAKTMREVADFVGEKLAPIDGVAATVTMFVLKKYKVNGILMDMEAEIEDDRLPVSA
ncbi:MAG: Lrp/AsnC ligand binding domain-containing protein, partial [Solobacterium sp.]|nr:Lrp/AsnC ligand binding domain-containing protein [Solobacterium sp.]